MNFGKHNSIIWAAMLCISVQTAGSVGPLDTWHPRNSPSDTNPLFSVVFGTGLFVAVGQGGAILSSTDGTTWAHQNSGTTDDLGPIIYGSGLFLARGLNALFRSSDGTNWTSSEWAGAEPIDWLDFANERFFVFSHDLRVNGDHAIIYTSTDTTNWTRFNTGRSGAIAALTYTNRLYVAVGTGLTLASNRIPLVLLSSDAITWKRPPFDFDSPLYWDMSFTDVTFGNGVFAAVFESVGSGGIMSSPDGTNWTIRLAGPPLSDIAFGDGIFVAVGSLGSLVTSTDGIHWTERDPGTRFFLSGPAYGQNTFVAVGGLGIIIQSDPIVSLELTRGANAELSLTGPPGLPCEIQAVDEFLATNNWQSLGRVTLTNSAVSWTDPESINKPQRFYRAILQQ